MPYNLANHNTIFKEYNLTAVPTSFLANLQKKYIQGVNYVWNIFYIYKP